MERQRDQYLGAFAEVLKIRPWEIDLLTLGEFRGLCDYIDRRNEKLSESSG